MGGELEKRKDEKRAEAERQEGESPPYPKGVFLIIGNEFCERLSYYGMKAILGIYLHQKLHFSEDRSTVIYHTFAMLCYFMPLFGAMIADQLLGKFKTIVYISFIYVLGHLLKTLAAIPSLGVPPVEFSLIGLFLIAVGTGGIKPCVVSFGGDQFQLPAQARQLQTFFSVFYFSINAGSLVGTALTPYLREDVECFGEDTCYSLAFGVPAILMGIATVIIVLGRPLYRMVPPQGSILVRVLGSVGYGLKGRLAGRAPAPVTQHGTPAPASHWLDLSKEKYEDQLVEDVKCVLRVLVMYLPIPIFWALYDQTGSRWTFQATRMNGVVGSLGAIKPDQMQVINPLLILFLIPLFDRVIYPTFAKFNLLVKPLQRMTVGGLITACSFFVSGFLELQMMKTYAHVPAAGVSDLHLMSSLPCLASVRLGGAEYTVAGLSNLVVQDLQPARLKLDLEVSPTCLPARLTARTAKLELPSRPGQVLGVLLSQVGGAVTAHLLEDPDQPEKDGGAAGRVRGVLSLPHTNLSLVSEYGETVAMWGGEDDHHLTKRGAGAGASQQKLGKDYRKLDPGQYSVVVGGAEKVGSLNVAQGGVYSLVVEKDPVTGQPHTFTHILTQPNSVHILWLLPQIFVITVGEIMFSITGLEFSYSQAPESMKSVLQAAWLLTTAMGNVIVICVAEARAFDDQASEFFMFACLMLVDMAIFMWLAWR